MLTRGQPIGEVDLRRFRKLVDLMVVHDTEEGLRKSYHYDDELETFAEYETFKNFGAWTTVVSDTHPELVAQVKKLVNSALNVTII